MEGDDVVSWTKSLNVVYKQTTYLINFYFVRLTQTKTKRNRKLLFRKTVNP